MKLSDKPCSNCSKMIEQARLDASKGKANTCISCMHGNDVSKISGFTIISGKNTYSEIQLVDAETSAQLNAAQYRRGQSPGQGVRFKGK